MAAAHWGPPDALVGCAVVLLRALWQQCVTQRRQLTNELLCKRVLPLPAAAGAEAHQCSIHQAPVRASWQRKRCGSMGVALLLRRSSCTAGAERRLAAGGAGCMLFQVHHRQLQERRRVTAKADGSSTGACDSAVLAPTHKQQAAVNKMEPSETRGGTAHPQQPLHLG